MPAPSTRNIGTTPICRRSGDKVAFLGLCRKFALCAAWVCLLCPEILQLFHPSKRTIQRQYQHQPLSPPYALATNSTVTPVALVVLTRRLLRLHAASILRLHHCIRHHKRRIKYPSVRRCLHAQFVRLIIGCPDTEFQLKFQIHRVAVTGEPWLDTPFTLKNWRRKCVERLP